MKKIVLIKAAQIPLGGPIRPSGFSAEVDEDTFTVLNDRGVIALHIPAAEDVVSASPVEPSEPQEAEPAESDMPSRKSYPQLPKKTQGINVWREYARDNDIDVRGLSEKSELMGHIIKVVNS